MNPLFFLGFLGALTSFGLLRSGGGNGASNSGSAEGKTPPIIDQPDPETPVEEPETPVSEQPETPVEEPETPVSEQPETPVEEPETPVSEQPETPVEEPETPVSEQPETPVEEPETPVSEQPETPVEEPETPVSEQPAPTPEVPGAANPTPEAPEQTGGGSEDGGEVAPLAAQGTLSVYSGRVSTLDPIGDDVTSVRILSDVQHGTLTVNPDNTMALVMTRSDFVGSQSFRYEATHANGSVTTHTVNLRVQEGLQDHGWGTSEQQYMLATDENDKVIVEHGEVHTKVYVSGSSDALTRADIASLEGVAISQVTGAWVAANTAYGQSEGTALSEDLGMEMWRSISPRNAETSNWLLLERGYEYGTGGTFSLRGVHGESELHPAYIGAFGEGEKPIITDRLVSIAESLDNMVIQDVHLAAGSLILDANNVLFDNVSFSGAENVLQTSSGITYRNSDFIDIIRDESANGGDWETHSDRYQALFAQYVDGLLIDGIFVDHTAWAEGYDYDGDSSGGQPPSMFSHNLYLSDDLEDLTLRDSILMRAASTGAQIRSGGFIEDNVFLDNNIGLNFTGGQDDGTANYTLFTDNVVTSAGYRDAHMIGTLGWGADTRGQLSALVDNIIAHAADPNNPVEQALKQYIHWSYDQDSNHYYDDTIVYNWEGSNTNWNNLSEHNTDGLNTSTLDETTIQNFAALLLGRSTATIDDLAQFLRAQAADGMNNDEITAETIIDYFQQGFGIESDDRNTADTLRFVPDDLGDGVRWDNRLNWDTDDLPGTVQGDSVDLGGNEVVFNYNSTIDTLDLSGGTLDAYGGRLTATGGIEDAGRLELHDTGQIWANGSDGSDLDIDVMGGRFANNGAMSGANLTATDGQAILATGGAEFDVLDGDRLEIYGAAQAGFDGSNGELAILDLHDGATVSFLADSDGLGSIAEFRSGAFGESPNVASGIDLGGATLNINLSGLSSSAGTAFTLMSADELSGIFGGQSITGLGGRNANIVVDYVNDTVTLQLSSGSGRVTVETVGEQNNVSSGNNPIWDALTSGQGTLSETLSSSVPDEDDVMDDAA